MKDIFVYIFVVLVSIFFSRVNTIYYPDLVFKRYVTVKNKNLAKILIGSLNFDLIKEENSDENKNKLLIQGLVFYILTIFFTLLLIISSLTSRLLVELSFDCIFSITFFAQAFNAINVSKYTMNKAKNKKFSMFFHTLAIGIYFLVGSLLIFDGLISLDFIR